jgi:hypothetical protein
MKKLHLRRSGFSDDNAPVWPRDEQRHTLTPRGAKAKVSRHWTNLDIEGSPASPFELRDRKQVEGALALRPARQSLLPPSIIARTDYGLKDPRALVGR